MNDLNAFRQVFKTRRLTVHATPHFDIEGEFGGDYQLFVAFALNDRLVHTCMPVVTAMVAYDCHGCRHLAWLEVTSQYRRHGLASEFLDGLTAFLDPIDLAVGTSDVDAFLRAYVRRRRIAPVGV
jgi:GNAT superfamily N-acetyltransferase